MSVKQKLKILLVIMMALGSGLAVYFIPLKLGLDLQGGSRLVVECQDTVARPVTSEAVMGVLAVIRGRIDGLGVAEPIIQRKGERQIIIEMPGIDDPDSAIQLIGETALLEFVRADKVIGSPEQLQANNRLQKLYGSQARLATYELRDRGGRVIAEEPLILKETVLTGADLKDVGVGYNEYNVPHVTIKFTAEGAKTFYEVTRQDIGKPLAIVLDGRVISAPNINTAISGGEAIIEGGFNFQEARDLTIKLQAGSLPVPIEIVSNQTIGPSLGKDSIAKSKIAGLWSLGLIMLFMTIYYRLPGFLSAIALAIYALIVMAIFTLGSFTLTLPGIAGFIITLGMAVDANILIFERIKEELRNGKLIRTAIDIGFSKAFITIFDANVTTIIAVIFLLWLGTGSIKGFAVVMILGILVSMFSALFITRVFMDALGSTNLIKNKRLMPE